MCFAALLLVRKSLVRKCYFRIDWCVCIWDIVIIGPGIKLVSVYIPELGLLIQTSIMFKQQTFCAARRCIQIQQLCRWTKGLLSYVCWHTSSTGLSKWLCANSFRMVRRCSHSDPNVVWPWCSRSDPIPISQSSLCVSVYFTCTEFVW